MTKTVVKLLKECHVTVEWQALILTVTYVATSAAINASFTVHLL